MRLKAIWFQCTWTNVNNREWTHDPHRHSCSTQDIDSYTKIHQWNHSRTNNPSIRLITSVYRNVQVHKYTHTHTLNVSYTHIQTSIYVGWIALRFEFHCLQYLDYIRIFTLKTVHHYIYIYSIHQKAKVFHFANSCRSNFLIKIDVATAFNVFSLYNSENKNIKFILSVWTLNRIQQFNWSKIFDSKAGTNVSCDIQFTLLVEQIGKTQQSQEYYIC